MEQLDQRDMGLRQFQKQIEAIFFEKDAARGVEGTFMWFAEEFGELVRALRRGPQDNLEEEFADVLAWLASLASLKGVDLAEVATRRYGSGCPYCRSTPCSCGAGKTKP